MVCRLEDGRVFKVPTWKFARSLCQLRNVHVLLAAAGVLGASFYGGRLVERYLIQKRVEAAIKQVDRLRSGIERSFQDALEQVSSTADTEP